MYCFLSIKTCGALVLNAVAACKNPIATIGTSLLLSRIVPGILRARALDA